MLRLFVLLGYWRVRRIWNISGFISTGNTEIFGELLVTVSFFPPQIPHALTVIQTGAVAEFKHEFRLRNIQGVSGEIVNILGGGRVDYSE
jgi:hypothetical protein